MNQDHLTHLIEKHSHYGTFIARLGIAAVFLWFGIDKFVNPDIWVGWVPDWMARLIPISLISFMYLQGIVEVVVGALLLLGFYTRLAAILAVINLLGVELALIGTGQADVMLRDAGLLAASMSLFFTGSDFISLDGRIAKGKTSVKRKEIPLAETLPKSTKGFKK